MKKINWAILFALTVLTISCNDFSQYKTDAKTIAEGQKTFEMQCVACHNFKSSGIGPDLSGITTEASYDWLFGFIRNPQEKIEQGDERAKKLYAEYKTYMPGFNHLSKEDIEALLAYLNTQEKEPEKDIPDFGDHLQNPIEDTIPDSRRTLQLKFVLQAPATSKKKPFARINKILSIHGSQRNFIQDLNGILYEFKGGNLEPFLKIEDHFKDFMKKPGLGSGLGSYTFHPEYLKNGIFYTSHTEEPNSSIPVDFSFHDSIPRKIRWILTEWKHDRPENTKFTGTKREVMTVDMVTVIHGMQEITFNPTSRKGDPDYGKLYISIGDGGSAQNKYTSLTQDKSKIWGSILRIDPLGNNSKNGQYGIPEDNPFVNESNALGEIWAFGFRNPHRITWDAQNGNMLATDIGHHQIEELNLIEKGGDYGWPKREGTFKIHTETDMKYVYPLDAKDKDNYTYPIIQFDHDDGNAICGGFVYYGENIPELQGKYIFGTIAKAFVYMADASSFKSGEQTRVEQLSIALNGVPTTFKKLAGKNRVELRVGHDANGELLLYTKADGKIYKITGTE